MLSVVEDKIRKGEHVVKSSGELADKVAKEEELSYKEVPIHRLPQPFPQRLVKTTEKGK